VPEEQWVCNSHDVSPVTCEGKGKTGDAVENSIKWHAPVRPSDFLSLSRVRLL
jgi:hypothetical protein